MKKVTIFLAFLLFVGFQAAAQMQITGTITSADDGLSIPGVSVTVVGNTTIGTTTDIDGKFSLTVPSSAEALMFSFVGMVAQEAVINGRSVIDIVMESDVLEMDAVVVTAYGTATKRSFTGSAATVDAATIEKRQVSNVTQALSGAVAGVQVLSNNGQPGVSATIRIRGVGSINADSDPLYVVDGVPFDGDMSSINPADIESMTVLKDAASTALYGSRGANGIIMITTKKGSPVKSQISFDMKTGINSRSVENYEVLTSPQNYTELAYQSIYSAGINQLGYTPSIAHTYASTSITGNAEGGNGYQIYTVPTGENLIGLNGKLNPNATLGYSDGTYYYTPDNWADETFENNARQEYNLSFSGGNEKQTYYLSLNYLDDQGIVPNSGYSRISGRFSGDQKVKEWLKVGANVSINNIESNYPGEQVNTSSSGNAFFIANYIAPVYPIYVRDAATQQIILNNGRKTYDYGDGLSTNFSRQFMAIANPAGDLLYNKTDVVNDIVNTSWFAELTPIEGLKITARYGLNVQNEKYSDLGNAYMGQSAAYGGTAYQQQDRTIGFDQQYVALYNFDLNEEHKFDITAGYDGYRYETEYVYATGQNLYNPENYYINNAIDNLRGGGRKHTYATEGYFGRINYSFRNTYFFLMFFGKFLT